MKLSFSTLIAGAVAIAFAGTVAADLSPSAGDYNAYCSANGDKAATPHICFSAPNGIPAIDPSSISSGLKSGNSKSSPFLTLQALYPWYVRQSLTQIPLSLRTDFVLVGVNQQIVTTDHWVLSYVKTDGNLQSKCVSYDLSARKGKDIGNKISSGQICQPNGKVVTLP